MDTQCKAYIYVRDTYRRTGRGKSGFEMHYNRRQCSRTAIRNGLCTQHAKLFEAGAYISTGGTNGK